MSQGEKKKTCFSGCLFTEQPYSPLPHTCRSIQKWKVHIYVGHKFEVKTIRECLNMREMLETSHLSALMGDGEPPPTAPTHELVNALHMWDPLMQFRVSPKAWVITRRQTAGPSPAQCAALAPHLYGGRLSQLSLTKDAITHALLFSFRLLYYWPQALVPGSLVRWWNFILDKHTVSL